MGKIAKLADGTKQNENGKKLGVKKEMVSYFATDSPLKMTGSTRHAHMGNEGVRGCI